MLETAKRARVKAGQVFRYAIIEGKADLDPTSGLRGALKTPQVKHQAAITDPARMGQLLRAIDGFIGQPTTMYALKLAPLVFVRPGELRHAKWAEIDLDGAMWRIPAERMKMRAAHLVPLSRQAVALLRDLKPITDQGEFLFPSGRYCGVRKEGARSRTPLTVETPYLFYVVLRRKRARMAAKPALEVIYAGRICCKKLSLTSR